MFVFVPVKEFEYIDVIIRQKGGDKTATLKRIALVPDAKRNLFSAKMAVKTSGKNMTFFSDTAYLGRGNTLV